MSKKMKVMDMTEGNPVSLILRYAFPLFVGNIFQQIYTVVDTMIAGYNLGDNAIAAIGTSASLFMFINGFVIGLNGGYAIIVTQCFGAHNTKRLRQSIAGMLELNLGFTLVLTALTVAFLRPLMHFINTPDVLFNEAYNYMLIISCGMVASICYNMTAAILRAVGNSATSLIFLIISTFLNLGLDYTFIVYFKTGVEGAAFATVIAETCSALMCGVYLIKNYKAILPRKNEFRVPKEMLRELFSQGIAMALMYSVVNAGSVIYQRANNGLGEMIISAHTAVRRIVEMLMIPLATIAEATATFVGQNWGAKRKDRIQQSLKKVYVMELIWSAVSALLIFGFGSFLVRFITGTQNAEIVKNAVMSLKIHISFFPMLGGLFMLRTAMQAMGKKKPPVAASIIELIMKLSSAAWLIPHLGFLGTSITEPITWNLMLVFLLVAYIPIRKELINKTPSA